MTTITNRHVFDNLSRGDEDANPFEGSDVTASSAKSMGLHIKNPIKSLGQAYGNLSQGQKKNIMYVLQGTAAACLVVGGGAILLSGGSTVMGAGLMVTGGLNGGRSAIQYAIRKFAAKNKTKDAGVERFNSMLSGSTNMPQACSLSYAGLAAVGAYALRTLRYSVKNRIEKNEAKAGATERAKVDEGDTESEESQGSGEASTTHDPNEAFKAAMVTNSSVSVLGVVKKSALMNGAKHKIQKASSGVRKAFGSAAHGLAEGVKMVPGGTWALEKGPGQALSTFDRAATGAGHLIEKVPGGHKALVLGPGGIMFARSALQILEGCQEMSNTGAMAGLPLIIAGTTYVAAAFTMIGGDADQKERTAENHNNLAENLQVT